MKDDRQSNRVLLDILQWKKCFGSKRTTCSVAPRGQVISVFKYTYQMYVYFTCNEQLL